MQLGRGSAYGCLHVHHRCVHLCVLHVLSHRCAVVLHAHDGQPQVLVSWLNDDVTPLLEGCQGL